MHRTLHYSSTDHTIIVYNYPCQISDCAKNACTSVIDFLKIFPGLSPEPGHPAGVDIPSVPNSKVFGRLRGLGAHKSPWKQFLPTLLAVYVTVVIRIQSSKVSEDRQCKTVHRRYLAPSLRVMMLFIDVDSGSYSGVWLRSAFKPVARQRRSIKTVWGIGVGCCWRGRGERRQTKVRIYRPSYSGHQHGFCF